MNKFALLAALLLAACAQPPRQGSVAVQFDCPLDRAWFLDQARRREADLPPFDEVKGLQWQTTEVWLRLRPLDAGLEPVQLALGWGANQVSAHLPAGSRWRLQLRSDGQSRVSLPLGEWVVAAGAEHAVALDLPALVRAHAPLPAAEADVPPSDAGR
jgi:hypothetical protein